MSATDDIVAIRQLLSRYNLAGDRLRLEELAATFLPDGVLDTGRMVLTGRAEIAAGLRNVRGEGGGRPASVPLTFVRHHLTTCHIDLTGPDTAIGRTYFLVFTEVGTDHAGVYVDRFHKAGGEWLIAHREVRTDWAAPDSPFAGVRAVNETRRRQP